MHNTKNENMAGSGVEHDYSTATKFDVDNMITERLLKFHEALIARGQIKPIPQKKDWLNP